MKTALFAGSFDPITIGHLDIIEKASKCFDKLYIGVAINPDKKYMFSTQKRIEMVKKATNNISNIEVFEISGFLYKFCKQHNIQILVRSFRDNIDISYEENLARFNQDFNADLITMYIASNPNMKHISSSAIRMLLNAGESVKKYVPSNIVDICKI